MKKFFILDDLSVLDFSDEDVAKVLSTNDQNVFVKVVENYLYNNFDSLKMKDQDDKEEDEWEKDMKILDQIFDVDQNNIVLKSVKILKLLYKNNTEEDMLKYYTFNIKDCVICVNMFDLKQSFLNNYYVS